MFIVCALCVRFLLWSARLWQACMYIMAMKYTNAVLDASVTNARARLRFQKKMNILRLAKGIETQ